MDFPIIGAGNMGRGIATRLLNGDKEEAVKMAEELRSAIIGTGSVTPAEIGDEIQSDAVVLAVYYRSVLSILAKYGNQLSGKIIIDITNPLNDTFDDLAIPPGTSATEEIAKIAPPDAKVIKAFNTTSAGILVAGEVENQSLDVFIAGDDAEAKNRLAEAISAGGLRPIDVGSLRRARQLEGIGLLHIILQEKLDTDWGSAIKIIP
jgi:8-hydroxy-5-deazaflavin:NADPH oxidoreductase